MTEPLSREEIALRILGAFIRSSRPLVGAEAIRESFALAISFEEQSHRVGARPWRQMRSEKLAFNDDGQ